MASIRSNFGCIFVINLMFSIGVPVNSDSIADLIKKYNKAERPYFNGDPTHVEVNIHVNAITSIDAMTMDYKIDLLFRQYWTDSRLRHNGTTYLAIGHYSINDIWWPDTFFYNAKEGQKHHISFVNEFAQIYPNGYIKTSVRLALKLSCVMYLHYFPMDEQFCKITLGSFGYTTRDLFYTVSPNAVTFEEGLSLPEFIINREDVKQTANTRVFKTGNFSDIQFEFHIRRDLGFYLIQTYIPSTLIVILSWLSFWLDVHATPARVSLGLLTVLTMTTQNMGINAQLPRVSYVKGIDIWMSTCLVFVFGALLEYAWANVLARREDNTRERRKAEITQLFENGQHANKAANQPNGNVTNSASPERRPIKKLIYVRPLSAGHRLDKYSRVVFPVTFGFFSVLYWLHYWCRWFKNGWCT
ncbi:glycine receptor subunit alpha-2-like [Lineus longissimus]|uniref:glycine receptor subunit alpha-2-like n=1 Tax=Lineus longissimus TaxID=88925 RepID=UPI002B4E6FD8